MVVCEEEFLEALQDMARQYLACIDGDKMTHHFMAAGENCLDTLDRAGKVKTDDGVYYTWTKEKLNDPNF